MKTTGKLLANVKTANYSNSKFYAVLNRLKMLVNHDRTNVTRTVNYSST